MVFGHRSRRRDNCIKLGTHAPLHWETDEFPIALTYAHVEHKPISYPSYLKIPSFWV